MNNKNKQGTIMLIIIFGVFLGFLILLGLLQIFNVSNNQQKDKDTYVFIMNSLQEQFLFFKNNLIFTNTNGDGYRVIDGNIDENYDDDDFNSGNRGWNDDDLDAFKVRYGFLEGNEYENILSIDDEYKKITHFNVTTFSKLNIYTLLKAKLDIFVLDGDVYENGGEYKMKSKKSYQIHSNQQINIIDDTELSVKNNDIVLFFLQNESQEYNYYQISAMNSDGKVVDYFLPGINKSKNIDFYSLLYTYVDGKFYKYSKKYTNILPHGKKPIAPTYLRKEGITNSGTLLQLAWDINDLNNTGSFYLYREKSDIIDCQENTYYQKIEYPNDSVEIDYNGGGYYFVMCGSQISVEGTGVIFSTKSNVLYVE